MNDRLNQQKATATFQELGLKEYEAKSFVALTRVPQATAKDMSAISEVTRTRVYDAVSALELKGLVEIQNSKPKQFRAVSIDVAVETLRQEYDNRLESLRERLQRLSMADFETGDGAPLDVWAIRWM